MTDINLDDFDVYKTTGTFVGPCEEGRLVLVEKEGAFGARFCPFCESMHCLEKVEDD